MPISPPLNPLQGRLRNLRTSFFGDNFFGAWKGIAPMQGLVILLFVGGLWMMPVPTGLDARGWHLLILFMATILGIILKPLPLGAWALFSLAACLFTGTITPSSGLGAFGKEVVWLVVFAFFMAKGFIKTGLGSRVAYTFVKLFGKSSLGLAYGLSMTDFFMAPAIPSNAARAGGVLFPIVKALAVEYGSTPEKNTSRKIGAYLLMTVFYVDIVASATFLTAFAANALTVSIAKSLGAELSWMGWTKAAIVPAVVNILLVPIALYFFFPPDVKRTPEAPSIAADKLREMGPFSGYELIMVGTFVLLVTLWVLGDYIGVTAASAALLGVVILLSTGALTWQDIMAEESAWTTFIWFAILLGLGTSMAELGVMEWFGGHMKTFVAPFSKWEVCAILTSLFFFSHYFFASSTAHISSLYGIFLVTMIGAGVPVLLSALLLSWASTLSGGLTHYGTGPAPVYFGAGYVSVRQWWSLGLALGLISILIWGSVGLGWWYVLGMFQ